MINDEYFDPLSIFVILSLKKHFPILGGAFLIK
jgi:hypothetical protein